MMAPRKPPEPIMRILITSMFLDRLIVSMGSNLDY
jgi:hypothetical protein